MGWFGMVGLPDVLDRELAVLFLPVSEAFLILVQHLVVLFQLVAHLDLDGSDLVQLGGLLVEIGFEHGQFFFPGLQRLRTGLVQVIISANRRLMAYHLSFLRLSP